MSNELPDEIQLEVDGCLRVIRLNRPNDLNAANATLHHGLAGAFAQVDADPDARVAVITGNGRAFSAGGDFEFLRRMSYDDPYRREVLADARAIIWNLIACRIPIIAIVNGPAVGLGCSIVALSDIVYMAQSAHPHVLVGLVATNSAAITWPLLTSLQLAKEYAFTGERISAQRAAQIGLANHVVPDDEVLDAALDCARRLLRVPHQALIDTKRVLNLNLERAVRNVVDYAPAREERSFTSPETRSFLNRTLDEK